MKKPRLVIALGVITLAIGTAQAQQYTPIPVVQHKSHHPDAQKSTMRKLPPTPRQKGIFSEIIRLESASAAALDEGRYTEAEAAARQSMTLGGVGSGKSQELLAASLNAQGKTQEAFQAYKTIADEGGAFPRNMLPYALLLLKTGHWKQAVAVYNRLLPPFPDGDLLNANSHFSPDVPQPRQLATAIHIALGLTYGSSATCGRHSQDDKALAEFQKAQALTPNSALTHLYYGHQLKHMRRGAEAQAAFTKATEVGRGDVKIAAEKALRR